MWVRNQDDLAIVHKVDRAVSHRAAYSRWTSGADTSATGFLPREGGRHILPGPASDMIVVISLAMRQSH